jgi:hypothetical protein
MNVSEIHQREKKRQDVRKATYKEIYDQATRKVRRSVDVGAHYAMFEIPSFVMGMPSFDRTKALAYIKRQFENGGFNVTHVSGWELMISWSKAKTNASSSPAPSEAPAPQGDEMDYTSFLNLKKTAERLRNSK